MNQSLPKELDYGRYANRIRDAYTNQEATSILKELLSTAINLAKIEENKHWISRLEETFPPGIELTEFDFEDRVKALTEDKE